VVATFDTGTNPFHPCFERDWDHRGISTPRDLIRGYPKDAKSLSLTNTGDYASSLTASRPVLDSIESEQLYYVPGTNLSFVGAGNNAKAQFVDDYPHGASASSQIACADYGLGTNAELVIVNWYDSGSTHSSLMRWAADQSWIDVIHLNIQDWPLPTSAVYGETTKTIEYMIAQGKFVVIAAGNGVGGYLVNYPMEVSRYDGPPGSLVVGANDNGGWTSFSNLDPHVVMDGGATVAASHDGYGSTSFNGTSSSSPRVAGYVARLLGEARATLGHTSKGLLTIPKKRPRPPIGPLQDGVLTAPELHEVIRKTANPNPHDSMYDGDTSIFLIPQPTDLPFAFYPKMGYGEVSEHTIDDALSILLGYERMPERPNEDAFYAESERIRAALWN
jgi:hypothetical protein